MKKWLFRCVPACLISVLAACGGSGEGSTPPPANVRATAGDGWIQVAWDPTAGVDYFVFSAIDASLTALNWLNLAGGVAFINVTPPLTICSLTNGQQRWFTVNGRKGSSAGGPGSPLVSGTPRSAGSSWNAGTTLVDNLTGIGFAGITTCSRSGLATGVLTAVGPGATLFSSTDTVNWTRRTAPTGFTADLNAVANFTANPNNTTTPGLRTIAVGAGGASLVSNDGSATWTVGVPFNAAAPTLRALITAGSVFYAVGDGGAIHSTTDGITWATLASSTTARLHGIAFGNARFVAVGDGGVLVNSTDAGVTWTSQTIAGAGNLRAIAYGDNNNRVDNGGTLLINTFVAVGDNGTAVVSTDGGATWTVTAIPGAGELVAISYVSRFVAVDRAGNAFTSADGRTWSSPIATGRANLTAVVHNTFGFVAVGDGGVTTSSF